jgi:hypothetical protein
MTARKRAALSLLCLALFAFLMHWPVFLQGKTVSAFDLCYFRMDAYKGEKPPSLKRASNNLLSDAVLQFNIWDKAMYEEPLEFPELWNPYAGFGSPLFANGQAARLYPLKALAYPFVGVVRGYGFLCFFKMLAAGLFMWWYMRVLGAGYAARTLGSIAFMACGFMVVWLQWQHTSVALTLPLVLLGCEHLVRGRLRSGLVLVAVATALGVFGGHPETSFHVSTAAGLYLIVRLAVGPSGSAGRQRRSLRFVSGSVGVFVGATAIGALIAGYQLLPNIEFILHSTIAQERSSKSICLHALGEPDNTFERLVGEPRRIHQGLMMCLVPNTFGNPTMDLRPRGRYTNYNEAAAYAGVGTMLLALFAWRYCGRDRRIAALGALQLLGLGFFLGLRLVHGTVGRLPLFQMANNNRLLLVFCFANAAMAGLAFEHLLNSKRLSRVDVVWMSVIVAGFMWLVLRDYAARFASSSQEWMRAYGLRQLLHFLVFLVPWLVVLLLWRINALLRALVSVGLIGLLAADLYLIYFGYNPFIRPGLVYPRIPVTEFLQSRPGPVRVLPLDEQLGPNMLTLYGIEDPRIYDAVVCTHCAHFLERMGAEGMWHIVDEPSVRLCSVAAVRYILAPPEWRPPPQAELELVYDDGASRIYENGHALPPAYVSHAWREVASPEEACDVLTREEFPWRSCVAVEGLRGAQVEARSGGEPRAHVAAQIVERRPQRVTVAVPQGESGLLVLSDTFYPGWTASVDGARRPIHRVNGTFRGVFVEAGDRRVVFRYDPASFKYGIVMSVFGVAVLVAVMALRPGTLRHRRGRAKR